MNKVLHYGCQITLTYRDENGEEFLAYAEGFTSKKIRLKPA